MKSHEIPCAWPVNLQAALAALFWAEESDLALAGYSAEPRGRRDLNGKCRVVFSGESYLHVIHWLFWVFLCFLYISSSDVCFCFYSFLGVLHCPKYSVCEKFDWEREELVC